MTDVDDRWASICGWTFSVLIHAVSLGAAIVLAADFSLLPRPRPFQWDVSLVMAPRPEPITSEVPSPSTPGPLSPQSTKDSQISQSDAPHRTGNPVKNRERPRPRLDVDKLPSNLQMAEVAIADTAEDRSIFQESTASQTEITEDPEDSRTAAIAPPHTFSTAGTLAYLPASPTRSEELPPPDVDTSDPVPIVSEPAIQELDRLAYRPAPQFRDPAVSRNLQADYGWLVKVLYTQVEQLKRYPYLAKTNRWQGNVLLQAVIQNDGHIGDITVVESSGHPMLDRDASCSSNEYPLSLSIIRLVNLKSSSTSPSGIDWNECSHAERRDNALACGLPAIHHDLLRFFARKLGSHDLAADCFQKTYCI